MAEALERRDETPAPDVLVPERDRRAGQAVYAGRFLAAYALLVLVFGAALAGFAIVLTRDGGGDGGVWSSWQPTGRGFDRAREIAEYVAPRYRTPDGRQLATVRAKPPLIDDIPLDSVAIRRPSLDGRGSEFTVHPAAKSLVYEFCGLGDRCSIPGRPSAERGLLLRREALELALYTFKYVDDVDSVVSLLPPRPVQAGQNQQAFEGLAVYLRKADLREQLDRPLAATLSTAQQLRLSPALAPGLGASVERLDAAEGRRVDRLTRDRFFRTQFEGLPTGSAILILDPPEA